MVSPGQSLSLDFGKMDAAEEWFRAVTTIMIGWAALARTYGELNNYAQTKRQFEGAQRVFVVAKALLDEDVDATKRPDRELAHMYAREVIQDLGKTALQQHGDWLIMHRERKLDISLGAG